MGGKIVVFNHEITIIDRKTLDSYVLPVSRKGQVLNSLQSMHVAPAGKDEFILSSQKGTWLVNLKENTYINLNVTKKSSRHTEKIVNSSLTSSSGEIWSALSSGSIIRVSSRDPEIATVQRYGVKDGLSKGRNKSIIEGPEKNIWIATVDGLYQLEPTSFGVRRFGEEDGIPAKIFKGKYSLLAKNRKIYYGGASSVLEVDPFKLSRQRILSQPIFSQMSVNGEKISPKRFTSNLKLSFSPSQSNLKFIFGSTNFRQAKKTRFSVKLKAEDDWQSVGNTSSIDYVGLAPGEYQFQIKSRSENGPWSPPLNAVNFNIEFPIWQSWWAYTIYGIFGLLSLYFLQVYRESKLKRQAKVLALQVKNRTKRIATLLDKKNDLFAHVSHEIRTPLTLIRGPVKQLLTSVTKTDQKVKLNTALTNTNRLIKMVDQLLTLAKMNTSNFEEKQVYNVGKVLDFVCQSLMSLADKKNIKLIWRSDDNLFVEMTRNSLETILVNLCVNALKYSPPDSKVEVVACVSKLTNRLTIKVSDQGPGIEAENQKKIFERFTRINPTQDGVGLGLAIVKELIDKHQGHIEIETSNKEGSRFVVELPGTQVDSSTQIETENNQFFDLEADDNSALVPLIEDGIMQHPDSEKTGDDIDAQVEGKTDEKPNILIIDDTREMADYLLNLLRDDYQCEVAYDGEEGMQIAKSNCPDLILSDVMMPKLDGFGVVEQIRNSMATSHIPVILLTAIGDENSKLKAYQQNADDYITKPFLDEELKVRIQSVLEIRRLTVLNAFKNRPDFRVSDSLKPTHTAKKEEQFVKTLNKIIESHYMNSSFSVNNLSEMLNLTERTLQRKTRTLTGITPIHLLRTFRIEKAISLLINTEQSIEQVVKQTGFSNRHRFHNYFKGYTGMTPAKYREECKI